MALFLLQIDPGLYVMLGQYLHVLVGKNGKEGCRRELGIHLYGVVIYHLGASIEGLDNPDYRPGLVWVHHIIKAEHHIRGGDGHAIVPLGIFMEEEGVGQPIRAQFPAFG